MAQLTWHPDPASSSGSLDVISNNLTALAAVPDAVVQTLQLTHDSVSLWALHPSEQTGLAQGAYEDERQELGPSAGFAVRELARPRQHNVVWIDRYHLLARSVEPQVVSRMAGLYVGTEGRLVVYVHDASVNHVFDQLLDDFPNSGDRAWDDPTVISQCRFAIRIVPTAKDRISIVSAPPFRPQLDMALRHLANMVAHW